MSWSWDSLASSFENTLASVQDDLQEFTATLRGDTADAVDAVSESVAAVSEAKTVGDGAQTAFSQVSNLASQIASSLKDDANRHTGTRVSGARGRRQSGAVPVGESREDAQLREIRHNRQTYLSEPADPLEFAAWQDSFDLSQRVTAVSGLLSTDAVLRKLHAELVPRKVSYNQFWNRYFFALHQLKVQGEKRKALLEKIGQDEPDDEDTGWGDDDWGDDNGADSTPKPKSKLKTKTKRSVTPSATDTTAPNSFSGGDSASATVSSAARRSSLKSDIDPSPESIGHADDNNSMNNADDSTVRGSSGIDGGVEKQSGIEKSAVDNMEASSAKEPDASTVVQAATENVAENSLVGPQRDDQKAETTDASIPENSNTALTEIVTGAACTKQEADKVESMDCSSSAPIESDNQDMSITATNSEPIESANQDMSITCDQTAAPDSSDVENSGDTAATSPEESVSVEVTNVSDGEVGVDHDPGMSGAISEASSAASSDSGSVVMVAAADAQESPTNNEEIEDDWGDDWD